MFAKPKTWISGGVWRPKNPHSLEHLKYLYTVLCKNQQVTDANRSLLVETLRSISEILIWGDQNDGSVFDFFLEKNMLSFFLRYLRQKSGRYICVQLLQTLNILFENIANETSVYYLLSNNHINCIIVHKFDFSDEEVMAYYISFLKTLSLKLNKHTIHFFYNEHTNDFALYTEAIKFFNHSESMVRIAVRTITLNVYKVDDKTMLSYIRDRTAAPYFSNLVWFIGNHIIELDACVRNDADHQSRDRLADLVAEHLDHLHYLNDILCLKIDCLNDVLTDHLLNRLFLPLYVYSLTKKRKHRREDDPPFVSCVVSLFLLSEVFLTVSHAPLVRQLADIIFNGDLSLFEGENFSKGTVKNLGFKPPEKPLAQSLEITKREARAKRRHTPPSRDGSEAGASDDSRRDSQDSRRPSQDSRRESQDSNIPSRKPSVDSRIPSEESRKSIEDSKLPSEDSVVIRHPTESEVSTENLSMISDASSTDQVYTAMTPGQNSTDEEKLLGADSVRESQFKVKNRPFLQTIFNSLECRENDYEALFGLCLLYAIGHNEGIDDKVLDTVFVSPDSQEGYYAYLMDTVVKIIATGSHSNSKIRLATLDMAVLVLKELVFEKDRKYLQDRQLACILGAREESILVLRNFYKTEEIFLDMFEDEHRDMRAKPLNVEYLMMDASLLLPPTGTPLTGIEFMKRLPCGEVERARRAIRIFFLIRALDLKLKGLTDLELPLTRPDVCVKVGDVLDLNNSDLIACTVITRDRRERRFLVIDSRQLILVEPDIKRLGWGVVRFVGFLQDTEVAGDKEDSRNLHVTIHRTQASNPRPIPLLVAKFAFDDHIRCMAAKQRLSKGRVKARQKKMQSIARLLELQGRLSDAAMYPVAGVSSVQYQEGQGQRGQGQSVSGSRSQIPKTRRRHERPQHMNISDEQQAGLKPPTQVPDVQSPSATAFQTLNATASVSGSSTESAANSNKNAKPAPGKGIEIPLEDFSKGNPERPRRKSGPVMDTTTRRLSVPSGRAGEVKKRSSSYSPSRKSHPSTSFSSSPSPQVMKAAVQRLEKKTKNLLQRPKGIDAAKRVKSAMEEASATTTAELHKIGQQLLSMSEAPHPKLTPCSSAPAMSGAVSSVEATPSVRQNSLPETATVAAAEKSETSSSSPPKQSMRRESAVWYYD